MRKEVRAYPEDTDGHERAVGRSIRLDHADCREGNEDEDEDVEGQLSLLAPQWISWLKKRRRRLTHSVKLPASEEDDEELEKVDSKRRDRFETSQLSVSLVLFLVVSKRRVCS